MQRANEQKKIVPFLPMSTAKHCKIFYRNSLVFFQWKYNFWRGIWVLLWWLMTIFGGVSIWCWIVLSLEPIVPSLVVRKQDLCRLGWEKIHQKYTLQVILPLEVAKTALLQFGRNHHEGVLWYSAKYLSSSKSLVWQKMGSLEKKRFMWRIQWAQHYFPVLLQNQSPWFIEHNGKGFVLDLSASLNLAPVEPFSCW